MVQQLMELEHVEVVACRGLRVAFLVDGVDVTAPSATASSPSFPSPSSYAAPAMAGVADGLGDPRGGAFGSDALLLPPDPAVPGGGVASGNGTAEGARRVLLVDVAQGSPRLWLNAVVMALRKGVLGGGCPRDLLPFAMMVDAEPVSGGGGDGGWDVGASVSRVLRAHHIPVVRMSDHLGTALAGGAVRRLGPSVAEHARCHPSKSLDDLLAPGDEVAFLDAPVSPEASASGAGGVGRRGFSLANPFAAAPAPTLSPPAVASSAAVGADGGGADESTLYRYGRIGRWDGGHGAFVVEDSPSSSRLVPPDRVFLLHVPIDRGAAHAAAADGSEEAAASAGGPGNSGGSGDGGGSSRAVAALSGADRDELLAAASSGGNVARVRYGGLCERGFRKDLGSLLLLLFLQTPATTPCKPFRQVHASGRGLG